MSKGYRITFVSAIDGKPATKQFPNTTKGNNDALHHWDAIARHDGLTMFAVIDAPDTPRKYFASYAVKNALR